MNPVNARPALLFVSQQAGLLEEGVGELLVLRDLDGDVPRLAGDRRLDPLLMHAPAELDEALGVQAERRDAAALRLP